jgi:hypothetical protein
MLIILTGRAQHLFSSECQAEKVALDCEFCVLEVVLQNRPEQKINQAGFIIKYPAK